MRADAKVEVRTPNDPDYRGRVDARKYETMKRILLRVLPGEGPGLTQREMFAAVAKNSPKDVFPGTTHQWWAKCVQLDMEARGLVERQSGAKPSRWRRT